MWASDEAVTSASARVFIDANGSLEITGTLTLELVSSDFPPALAQGIVKVDVTGLSPDTCVHVQTETVTASGTTFEPAAPPFPSVCTPSAIVPLRSDGSPLANDLLGVAVLAPDGVQPATGTLLLLDAPELAAGPISAFVADGYAAPLAVLNLNDLFDAATGKTAEVAGDHVLLLTEFRGLACPALADHLLRRFRRAPPHEESATLGATVTELETPLACAAADTVCDQVIDVRDAQRVLNAVGSSGGECAFNSDLDVVSDDQIDLLDVQAVFDLLGDAAPFP